MKRARGALAVAVVALCLPLALPATTMKQTLAAIAVPKDGKPIPLEGLIYKATFTAELNTVRIDPVPVADADPVECDWILTGNNTDGQVHRVGVTVTLVDESGHQTASFSTKALLRPGAKGQSVSVHMKVSGKVWKETRTIRIAADWFS